jgi:hypothetical protein
MRFLGRRNMPKYDNAVSEAATVFVAAMMSEEAAPMQAVQALLAAARARAEERGDVLPEGYVRREDLAAAAEALFARMRAACVPAYVEGIIAEISRLPGVAVH